MPYKEKAYGTRNQFFPPSAHNEVEGKQGNTRPDYKTHQDQWRLAFYYGKSLCREPKTGIIENAQCHSHNEWNYEKQNYSPIIGMG